MPRACGTPSSRAPQFLANSASGHGNSGKISIHAWKVGSDPQRREPVWWPSRTDVLLETDGTLELVEEALCDLLRLPADTAQVCSACWRSSGKLVGMTTRA